MPATASTRIVSPGNSWRSPPLSGEVSCDVAVIGGGIIFVIAQGRPGFDASESGFATNGWGDRSPTGANFGSMMLVELVFTALLVGVAMFALSWQVTVLCLLLASTMAPLLVPATGTASSIIIAGNGPELPTIERLARTFEKGHLGSVVEIQWEQDSDPIELVKSGQAHLAVTGETSPDLNAIPIAWDGIAVVVDSTNPVKEVTTQQVADIFAGKVKRWSALGGPDTTIQLIDRPQYQHIRHSFEEG